MLTPNPSNVLKLLRKLPPRERLKVISQALPEIEKSMAEKHKPRKSMSGLWKDLRPAPSAKDIDEARKEMWRIFPREDVA